MSKILFTDYDTVEYSYEDSYGRIRESIENTKEYFNELDNELWNSEEDVFLEYDEKTNKFTLLSEDDTYELVPTKKQMEEFKNNENTLFNNKIRECLKDSEDKRHYHKIKESGVFDGVDDALFFVKYRDARGFVNTNRTNGARKYIAENIAEDFDKHINYFNDRIAKLNKEIEEIEKDCNKSIIVWNCGFLFFIFVAIFFIILSVKYYLGCLFGLTIPIVINSLIMVDINRFISDKNEKIDPYKEEIKDIEAVIEKLKEKELGKTNTIQEEIKDNSYEKKIENFKRELINVFYNNEFNIFEEENNADSLKVAILLKEYELEMNMFNEQTLTKEIEKDIQNKYMNKANELKDEILSRSYPQKSISEMNIDEVQALLSTKPEKGYSRSLRQKAN